MTRRLAMPAARNAVTGGTYRWSEEAGRNAVLGRCENRCEGCGAQWNGQVAHRVRKGQGGPWSPANLLALCGSGTTGCHGRAHANPWFAEAIGWELPSFEDPEAHPAWILTPHRVGPGWHLLTFRDDADGVRRHVVIPVVPEWRA